MELGFLGQAAEAPPDEQGAAYFGTAAVSRAVGHFRDLASATGGETWPGIASAPEPPAWGAPHAGGFERR
jgi:hypothetical protein